MTASPYAQLRDRIAGAFYGLLVGDALGCPVEGWSPERIRHEYGQLREMEESSGSWRPRGLHSDDGQQAIALCDAVLAMPAHPGPAFAERLVALLRFGPSAAPFGLHRGTGSNFRMTVSALASGIAWDQAATITAGNGAAMRIAPIALYHRDDDTALMEGVIEVSRVTHKDVRGIAAAGAVAWLVAHALQQTGPACVLGSETLLAFVYALEDRCAAVLSARDHLHSFSSALAQMLASLDQPRQTRLSLIESLAHAGASRRTSATAGFVLGSVLTSIMMFLTSANFESTLIETVMLGGDADTTGAMVGQMCGALYGEAAIPQRWRSALLAHGALEDRINALVVRQASFAPAVSTVELERPWAAILPKGRTP